MSYPESMYGTMGDYQVQPEVRQWFEAVDRDRSGKISAMELKAALANGQGGTFSDTACNLMIGMYFMTHYPGDVQVEYLGNYQELLGHVGMFDKEKTGTIDLNEFQALYNYINAWLGVFRGYDRDNSGSIQEGELSAALTQMGYRFSPEFIQYLIKKSDFNDHQSITVDQFIVLCVQIQKFTEAFRKRDTEQTGVITIGFEDFLNVALSCNI